MIMGIAVDWRKVRNSRGTSPERNEYTTPAYNTAAMPPRIAWSL